MGDKLQQSDANEQTQVGSELESRLHKMESFMNDYQKQAYEAEVTAREAEIDTVMKEFAPKYKFADEAAVLAQAEAWVSQGNQLDKGAWEKIYKAVHQANESRYQEHYKQQFNKQKAASSAGRDTAAGGGTPGQAPRNLKLGDVKKVWEEDLRKKGF
jgi:hypothetical protein